MLRSRKGCVLTVVTIVAALLISSPAPAGAHADPDVLRSALDQQAARHPDDTQLYLRQAQLHRLAHKWDTALTALDRAALHGADTDAVTAERGMVFLDSGWPNVAIVLFDRVLAHRPANASVRFARGHAWLKLDRPDTAARDFGDAIAAMSEPTPDHVFARRDALLAAGRHEAALRAVDEGITRLGPVPSLQLAAVDLLLALGRRDEALLRIDALLARTPYNAAWLARRGDILAQAGRQDDARHAYARALLAIEARPERRRGRRIDALGQRLRAVLAASDTSAGGNP